MQNTRITLLFNVSLECLFQWAIQPWRRTSLTLISLLFGFFLASAISTTFGAGAKWDIVISGITVLCAEGVSWIFYRRRSTAIPSNAPRHLFLVMLNAIKIGVSYGMVLEACKLGS
jgi:hypothetical protein